MSSIFDINMQKNTDDRAGKHPGEQGGARGRPALVIYAAGRFPEHQDRVQIGIALMAPGRERQPAGAI